MRFHVLGVPHTVTSPEYVACAYTQKVLKLCRMLTELGHHVIHYGNADSQVTCSEHVTVTTAADLKLAYPDFDYRREVFRFALDDHAYRTFYANAIAEIGRRKQPLDFLLCMWGHGHRAVADAHPELIAVEPGIGYSSGFFARWKVFESYALLHAYHGLPAVAEAGHCENYSVVIPNFFDLGEFDFSVGKGDYFLCLGRVNAGKGVHIAIDACQKAGVNLVVAGQGKLSDVGYGGDGQPPVPERVHFFGHANGQQRRDLLRRARAVFVLSQYIEPFGGVAIEAGLSGTPVITSDWGAFPETVLHGRTGFRCRTFGQILGAIRNINRICPTVCRDWAAKNYSMERIAPMYDAYFRDVMNVYTGNGWYEPEPDRHGFGELCRFYPSGD